MDLIQILFCQQESVLLVQNGAGPLAISRAISECATQGVCIVHGRHEGCLVLPATDPLAEKAIRMLLRI